MARRGVTLAAVVGLHLLLLGALAATGNLARLRPAVFTTQILRRNRPLPPPPRLQVPLPAAPAAYVPTPEIKLAAPPKTAAIRATTARPSPPVSHFGAAADTGLGLDIAAAPGGGAGARGSLAGFEAAVRRQVVANKHQPSLAWDRRNTCVVNYRVTVSRSGGLAGLSIDPCAEPEINEAARAAIRAAAPFPPPPLGNVAEVSGTLIFHP